MHSQVNGQRIVIFRPGQFGDTLVAFPVIEGLAQLYPGVPIIYCTNRYRKKVFVLGEEVLNLNPLVKGLATYYVDDPVRKNWSSLKQQLHPGRDDLLIYLPYPYVRPLQVLRDWLFFFSLGFRKFGALKPSWRWARQRPHLSELPRESERLAQSVQASGLAVQLPETCRVVKDEGWADQKWKEWGLGTRPVLAVCPGTKMQAKRWPLDRYLEVGKKWHARTGAALIIVGGPEEAESACTLVQGWPQYGFSACGASISQTAAVLARAVAYCGNDTGSMHLAGIMGVRCVAVFSARHRPRLWHPYGEHHLVLRSEVPCAFCGLETCPHDPPVCLDKITGAEVLAALEQVWEQPRAKASKGMKW
jgi:heptosyltransferase-3